MSHHDDERQSSNNGIRMYLANRHPRDERWGISSIHGTYHILSTQELVKRLIFFFTYQGLALPAGTPRCGNRARI